MFWLSGKPKVKRFESALLSIHRTLAFIFITAHMYKLKRFFLTFLFVGITSYTLAQTSSGVVLEGQVTLLSNSMASPGKNVIVSIEELNLSTFTDSLGNFRFDNLVSGIYGLQAASMDFQTLDTIVTIGEKSQWLELNIQLNCNYSAETAKDDIARNQTKILLSGGVAPTVYPNQKEFEIKFNLTYFELGCHHVPHTCLEEYNQEVFRYLDEKYGQEWRDLVRQDVIGLAKSKPH